VGDFQNGSLLRIVYGFGFDPDALTKKSSHTA
jgi:hypothetical protein